MGYHRAAFYKPRTGSLPIVSGISSANQLDNENHDAGSHRGPAWFVVRNADWPKFMITAFKVPIVQPY